MFSCKLLMMMMMMMMIYIIYIYIYICIYIIIVIRYIYIYIYNNLHGIHDCTTERFLEVAIESWPVWDLNRRPLNSVQTLNRLGYQAMSSTRSQSQFCTATSTSSLCPVFTFNFGLCLRQSPQLF